ncbi:hypothetical protein A9K55_006334 [Cordyceps militaris]|uniref:Uncharacterized protein n=1 Tax=Cordyceps militaris TaxID=73501 RepID=A0A2H4SCD0_CORMI|nr:hypothetical protein A9K55_006334 [Cordyceps militaris]
MCKKMREHATVRDSTKRVQSRSGAQLAKPCKGTKGRKIEKLLVNCQFGQYYTSVYAVAVSTPFYSGLHASLHVVLRAGKRICGVVSTRRHLEHTATKKSVPRTVACVRLADDKLAIHRLHGENGSNTTKAVAAPDVGAFLGGRFLLVQRNDGSGPVLGSHLYGSHVDIGMTMVAETAACKMNHTILTLHNILYKWRAKASPARHLKRVERHVGHNLRDDATQSNEK